MGKVQTETEVAKLIADIYVDYWCERKPIPRELLNENVVFLLQSIIKTTDEYKISEKIKDDADIKFPDREHYIMCDFEKSLVGIASIFPNGKLLIVFSDRTFKYI